MTNPFSSLRLLPRMIVRLMSGEVLEFDETMANFGMSRLRLTAKREAGTGEVYAVLSMIASGNHQYCHLSAQELDEFANIARRIQATLRANRPADLSTLPATRNELAHSGNFGEAKPCVWRPPGAARRPPRMSFPQAFALLIIVLLVATVIALIVRRRMM